MGNGNDSMAFGDFIKVLSGYNRAIFDTVTVNSVPNPSTITFVDRQYNTEVLAGVDTYEGYYLQFLTGVLAGQVHRIADTDTNSLVVEPQFTPEPEEGDIAVITNIRNNLAANLVNIEEWGGTELTGDDITTYIQNLDLTLTNLLAGIRGTGGFSFTEVIEALRDSDNQTLADNEDISGSVDYAIPLGDDDKYRNTSLYIRTAGAINITLEFSPENSGSPDYFEPSESPLVFNAAGENIYQIDYTWKAIQLTGSNATNVTAKIMGLT